MADSVRIDKFLWAIRVYKTRSEATEACNGNKVKIDGVPAKPSRPVKIGQKVEVRKGAVLFTYKVKALLENRVGAKLVDSYAENLTPEEELRKLHAPTETFFVRRDRGAGRPTKKDRREMQEVWDTVDFEHIPEGFQDFGDDSEDDEEDYG